MNRKHFWIFVVTLLSSCAYAGLGVSAPLIDATFGADGESGIYFDLSYDQFSNDAQTTTPGINFAGAGGIGVALAQVHEFDAAVSSSLTGGEGYFLTDSTFETGTGLTVTPLYTDTSPAQTGASYVFQHYTIENLTAAAVSNIWFMSYVNADLLRATTTDNPPQRVGVLDDEALTISNVTGSSVQNISVRQYQSDGTEIFAQALMYDGALSGADAYLAAGPGTYSGGADFIYSEIFDYGASNFIDASGFYASGVPVEYSTIDEYAFSLAFDIGTLDPGQVVELVVAISTEEGNFAEGFFNEKYPIMLIPEPTTILCLLLSLGAIGFRKRK